MGSCWCEAGCAHSQPRNMCLAMGWPGLHCCLLACPDLAWWGGIDYTAFYGKDSAWENLTRSRPAVCVCVCLGWGGSFLSPPKKTNGSSIHLLVPHRHGCCMENDEIRERGRKWLSETECFQKGKTRNVHRSELFSKGLREKVFENVYALMISLD